MIHVKINLWKALHAFNHRDNEKKETQPDMWTEKKTSISSVFQMKMALSEFVSFLK